MLNLFFPGQPDQGLWHHLLLHGTLPQERTLLFPSEQWPFLWHLYLEVCLGIHCQHAEHNVHGNLAKGTFNKDVEHVLCGRTKLSPLFLSDPTQLDPDLTVITINQASLSLGLNIFGKISGTNGFITALHT